MFDMKKVTLFSAILLSVLTAGCGGGSKEAAEGFITVDVNASYPEKELILQDFMDVEYIPLETAEEFITQGKVAAVGKHILLVSNRINDGNIFVFDRSGKALRKINRFGQSGQEYTQITKIILDEEKNEMYVSDYPARKINVYDLEGNFKRSFPFADTCYYAYLFDYDPDHLIGYKSYLPTVETAESCHVLISKQDGSITREITFPAEEIETPVVIKGEISVNPRFFLTVPSEKNWVLARPSCDTIYAYLPDGSQKPLIARTPSIHTMDPEKFLFLNALTDRYYFMQIMKKGIDFAKMKGYPTVELVYDKQEKSCFQYTFYNDDYSVKEEVYVDSEPGNHEIATWETLNAPDLAEAYEKGQLKGRLKEIASGLDEEANPVVMLIKPKK